MKIPHSSTNLFIESKELHECAGGMWWGNADKNNQAFH